MSNPAKQPRPWRLALRGLHRDAGFLAVGLTFVYAISGIALNHIDDWDPSFVHLARVHEISTPLPQDDREAAAFVMAELGIEAEPLGVFGHAGTIVRYEIELEGRRIIAKPDRREILVQGETETVQPLGDALPTDDWEAAAEVLKRLGIIEQPKSVHRVTIPVRDIEITWENRTLRVQAHDNGADVIEDAQRPRFLFHAFNWLHLNRGKQAWTWFANGYAIVLLFLATSGMLMVRGRQGVFGRGGVFLAIGIFAPLTYFLIAGP